MALPNARYNADGSLNQTRLQPRNAGFGAATGAQNMRNLQPQLRFTLIWSDPLRSHPCVAGRPACRQTKSIWKIQPAVGLSFVGQPGWMPASQLISFPL